ncbi:MAG: ABC transporter ATP-binding protein, partial [Sulfurimonas sp.]|nr:ABC transporter ATP-binding protein [Sulfurimonas sp.]
KELDTMEKESNKSQTQVKDQVQTKQKVLKLTFKEKIALEELPKEIEKLELEIEEKNRCLADPKCYEDIGITQLANELAELETIYEQKMEELFAIEEKEEEINS